MTALSSCIEMSIVVSTMDITTASLRDSAISKIGNSYLQLCANAMTSLSIFDIAVSVYKLDFHNNGKFEKVILAAYLNHLLFSISE